MERRSFLKSSIGASLALVGGISSLRAAYAFSNTAVRPGLDASSSNLVITKISYYAAPGYTKPLFNQARGIVVVHTNKGITGVGEGGSPDTIRQCAEMLIGEDPFRIEHLWQLLYRGMFYPAGREKLHAIGGIEMALWDIKGKALNAPVYELLGGSTRNFVECYATGYRPSKATTEEGRAKDCIKDGFRCYRIGPTGGGRNSKTFEPFAHTKSTIEYCKRINDAVGGNGNWAIDIHTRFDFPEAIRICNQLEQMEPYFVEDIVRSENVAAYSNIRKMTRVPIAVGEQFGDKWDINEFIEKEWIDFSRVTLPNCGGISELKKIIALAETHYVGNIPHFTGPLSTAALVHVLGSSTSSKCLMELAGGVLERPAYFQKDYMLFEKGRLYLNPAPGLGVEFYPEKADLLMEITENTKYPHPTLEAPDGSLRNW